MISSRRTEAVVAGLAFLVFLVGLALDARTALAGYAVAWFAISAVPIGALAVMFTTYLVRGGWTSDLHVILSSAALTMPVTGLLFIPLLVGEGHIYPWAADPGQLNAFKSVYLNEWFFTLRALTYFVIWTILAVWASRSYANEARMIRTGSIGLIIWTLTASFAGIDWIESFDSGFHSSIFGLLVIDHYLLAGLGFGVFVLAAGGSPRRMSVNAYAGTFLSVLLLWAYMHAMQYIIIWAGNIPSEVAWYLARLENGWGVALWALIILQFIVPFFALLSERVRGSIRALLWLGAATLALRYLEAAILVLPGLDVLNAGLLIDIPAAIFFTGAVWLLAWRHSLERALAELLSGRASASQHV
ncbi:MAG TPA: hypothetical protein VFP60_09735 [Pseudolabrys sp.]|nr:hypothetical protein [Pseudolabrys sp.]